MPPPAPAARAAPAAPSGRVPRRRFMQGLLPLAPAIVVAGSGCSGRQAGAARATPAPAAPPGAGTAPPAAQPAGAASPLTGQAVDDPARVRRRIVAVKIDNAPLARPQLGLGAAEVVYEQLAEGGTTRFLAMFLADEPERVGPVRSARLTDIYLGQEWDFLLAYAGAGRTTSRLLEEALIPLFKAPELGERLEGTPYARDPGRPVPHNLFVRIAEVRAAARGVPGVAPEAEIRPFPFQPPPAAGPLRTLSVPYRPPGPANLRFAVTWQYDAEAGVWQRLMGGAPHVDALSGRPIQVENVLVQYAEIFTARNVEPDSAGNPVLDAVLRGENRARLFHSGHLFEGTWAKEHDRAKTRYLLDSGAPLPFRPGRVWIHLVPTDFPATWG